MNYVIFDSTTGDLIDIVDFTPEQKTKYEKTNPNHELELEDDLMHNVLEDDEYIDELEEEDFDY